MKYRMDFVTNSSSSSFLAFSIESHTLSGIIKRFQNEIKESLLEDSPCAGFDVYGDTVEYSEVGGYYCDSPENILEALNCLLDILMRGNEEEIYISQDEKENEEFDLSCFNNIDSDKVKIAIEIFQERKAILEDIEAVDFKYEDYGWGGDDDSRFDLEMFEEDVLTEMFEKIAKEHNILVDDVTEDMFYDYVADKTSVSADIYTFDKKKGIDEASSKYYLEDC